MGSRQAFILGAFSTAALEMVASGLDIAFVQRDSSPVPIYLAAGVMGICLIARRHIRRSEDHAGAERPPSGKRPPDPPTPER